ncbi:MAG: tRNA (N6-isopentenyl adenosine(37)-C2)-methylthiotransferase MiaB [Oscillospiraceae bacterium]|nr:tRNA (N6-isopentenyl adenosine(37)-C2)-methylthiotransferase MiaB [Oscillospiraceae bacterium]
MVDAQALARQGEYAALVRALLAERFGRQPAAYVHTYGCQGNEADGERLQGMLAEMGFSLCDDPARADFVLLNTCAIREHAEDRVLGNVGRLKTQRQESNTMRIALCGCMVQQAHMARRLRAHYPFIDLLFGTHAIHRLPELLYRLYSTDRRIIDITGEPGAITEGLPLRRESGFKAWLPVMYGCDNFCSYCVVPLVRGRERSRTPRAILEEARGLINAGYKEITLLGQNVNSYRSEGWDFPRLLRELDKLEGDYWLRFMTSHPKDCSHELLDAMAAGAHIARHLHLPVQSGCDRILREMNRKYTSEQYLDVVRYARQVMPDLSLTGDVIVGFPGESYEDFRETLALVEHAQYTSLFTFIFSAREGTRAASMPDLVSHEEKVRWLQELTSLQEGIAAKRCAGRIGQCERVLCEGKGKRLALMGRTGGSQIIEFDGPEALIGHFVQVKILQAKNWLLDGVINEK